MKDIIGAILLLLLIGIPCLVIGCDIEKEAQRIKKQRNLIKED